MWNSVIKIVLTCSGFKREEPQLAPGIFLLGCVSEQAMGNLPRTLSNYHRTSNILLQTIV